MAISTNIRLGWKGLQETKHSSFLWKFVNYVRKKFYNIVPMFQSYKTFYGKLQIFEKARVFASGKPFHDSIVFAGKLGAYPSEMNNRCSRLE